MSQNADMMNPESAIGVATGSKAPPRREVPKMSTSGAGTVTSSQSANRGQDGGRGAGKGSNG